MRRNAAPAETVAEAVRQLVHAVHPPARWTSISLEMRLAALVPQALLDAMVQWNYADARDATIRSKIA